VPYTRAMETSGTHEEGEKAKPFASRKFAVALVWLLLVSAIGGTYLLSRDLEERAGNAAAVYLGTGRIHEINLYHDRAEPVSISIRAGDELLFVARDDARHNIAEERSRRNDARLESGEFGPGESYSLVFQTKGTMDFYDRQNQDIHVTVVIE
jgi:plastocyanin